LEAIRNLPIYAALVKLTEEVYFIVFSLFGSVDAVTHDSNI